MGLNKILKIRLINTIMIIGALIGTSNISLAQSTDSTKASITAATDTAAAVNSATNTSGVSSSSAPLISTAVDTTASSIQIEQAASQVDKSPMYKSAAYYTMWFFLLCIFVGIIGKILKVYDLSGEIQGKKSTVNWSKIQGVLFVVALVFGLYGVYWSYSVQGAMSITEAASEHGKDIDFMFNITLIITTIVFIITHILLFGFSFKYRGSEKKKAYFYPHNNAVERLWTIIPAITLTILVLLGFFTWRNITNVSKTDQDKALKLEVTGEQFKWSIRYSGNDNLIGLRNYKLTTPTNNLGIDYTKRESHDDQLAGEIVLPVNRPVRVTVNSKDVLHSFYISDFRVQVNAVPGMPTYFQFTPIYTTAQMREKLNNPKFDYILLCAKICGSGHYNMQAKVTVVSDAEYQAWITKQPLFYNDDVKKELQMAAQKAATNNNIALNTNIKR